MKCRRWVLFAAACLAAIATEVHASELPVDDDGESFTELISSRDAARESGRDSPSDGEASRDGVVGEAVRDVSGEVSREVSRDMASAGESSSRCDDVNATPRSCVKTSLDQLREKTMRLTYQLGKSVAAQDIAKQREEKLALMEREKYCYVKSASEKVMKLVENVKQAESLLTMDTSREQEYQLKQCRIHRMQNRAGRRLQVIRRLLAGAEVGLVHLESDKKLNACIPPK